MIRTPGADLDRIQTPQRARRRRRRGAPAPAPAGRVRRPGGAQGAARGSRSGPPRPAARRSTTSCSPARPASGKTSLARIVAEELERRRSSQTAGPALERKARHRRVPDRPRAARGVLRGRDPPAPARGRGDVLSRDGGRPAADHARHRRRARRSSRCRPAAVHADRRDHPRRAADDAAARPLRHPAPPRPLRPGRPRGDRRAQRRRPERRRCTWTARSAIAERSPRHAARRQPPAQARARLRAGPRRRQRSTPRPPTPRWTCWGSTTRAWTGWTARS